MIHQFPRAVGMAAVMAAAISMVADAASASTVYVGRLKQINLDSIVLTVNNKDHTIFVGDKTVVTLNTKKVRLADLKTGFRATVSAQMVGTRLTASSISAQSIKPRALIRGVSAASTPVRGIVRNDPTRTIGKTP